MLLSPALAAIEPGPTVSMPSTSPLTRPPVVPPRATENTLGATLSLRSASLTVSVPPLLRVAPVSARESVELSPPPTVISGASFVPLIVMTTVWSSKALLSSVARTV